MDAGWSISKTMMSCLCFWPRYSRFHIFFPAFVLSWTHIGSSCVHSYVHAGIHLAFWKCVCAFCFSVAEIMVFIWSMRGCIYCIFMIQSIGIKELTAISSSYIWKVLFAFVLRLSMKMLQSVILFLFLFQTRPQLTGRARMRYCGGVMGTKRWISNFHKLYLTDNVLVKRAVLWMRKSYIIQSKKRVTWIKE